MKHLARMFILMVASLTQFSCEKEANRKLLNAHFSYTANGKTIEINEGILFNENLFECRIISDTSLQIMVSKVYDGAGFHITDEAGIKEGTYVLNAQNKAYFVSPTEYKSYYTTRNSIGSLTLKKGTFQGKTLLQTLEGTFSFNATDTSTGKTVAITKGTFLMELKD